MDTVATSLADDEEWELYNDDGFVYKRKKRRLNPDEAALAARPPSMDPEAEERNRRERKRKTLLKLKERYQTEIDRWELLSNTLRAMEERARQRQEHEDTPSFSALPLSSPEIVNGSLVDELLLQVEAQEAIIRDVSNLCDVAEAMCNAQEEQMKQSFIDLPIWTSPHELIASLCVD
ncbi:uncharacterized protein LOC115976565 [Quercus lobata]|uniref:Uncharacterized protein n=1 Tax=Quercus lobata TaxID=97700 RepID=A0A7N2KZJ7_QUELO|nr:uncharacterized protein LOC115976565 [Quercus lobata]